MKYLKTFLENGQIISEEEGENILIPNTVELTGHIGAPIKNIRSQKLTKEPKVKSKFTRDSDPHLEPMQPSNTKTKLNNTSNS